MKNMYSINSYGVEERIQDAQGFIESMSKFKEDGISITNKQQLRPCSIMGISIPHSYAIRFD